jgi:polyisoprenoid-binding protein YceI
VQGRFDKVAGTIHADPNNMKASGVSFTIQTDSVDTAVAPRDADLRSANFFDAAKNPEITFSSMRVSKRGKGYFAEGRLTMHGVTKPISFLFNAYGPIADPWKGTRIGIVSDPFVINREDFGMNADVPMVGSKVTVRISLEAVLDK